MPYWDNGHTWGWFGAMTMIVTIVLLWGGLGAVVYLVVHRLGHAAHRGGADRTADEILDERFARGEINEDELKARRAALHRSP